MPNNISTEPSIKFLKTKMTSDKKTIIVHVHTVTYPHTEC